MSISSITIFFQSIFSAAIGECSGIHETWNSCGSACPRQCPFLDARTGKLTTGPEACIAVCRSGCFCEAGYVRDAKRSGECVQTAKCTAP